MGMLWPELSLEMKAGSYVPESVSGFIKQVSMIGDVSERVDKLDEFVCRLQDEFNKIQVFQRELPLCMLLLKDAMLALKQETSHYKTRNAYQPVLEEFIPLNKDIINNDDDKRQQVKEEDCSGRDKKDWMSSVQLWNSDDISTNKSSSMDDEDDDTKTLPISHKEEAAAASNGDGFVIPDLPELKKTVDKVPGLCLVSPGTGMMRQHPKQVHNRKQRRCWSADLHRRFVDALTHLGGPQVATPKQIRELMRVDGLTNDEVKSHLQKYRLHSRRVPNKSAASNDNGLASSWPSEGQYCDSSKPSSLQSGSPEGPLQFPGVTGGTSTTAGDSMEDEDDEKSESYSWKGHAQRPGSGDA